ncbi:MAG: RNA polymerase sigma factor [Acidobacteriaceae bacterium]
MAAKDGNPGQENPREIEPRWQPGEPVSDDADPQMNPDYKGYPRSGAVGEGTELPSGATPTPRNLRASKRSDQEALEVGGFSDDEQDADVEESGNILSEEGLEQASESPINPESEAFWEEETQLSSDESVRQGMGTIALERIPIDEQSARLASSRLPTGLAGDMSQMSDAEIMQRAGTGDETCLEFLIAKYRRPIISFMYRMVHNQAVAEELAQEVFLRVYRARATYRAEARFSTWLYRIASNMAINHARDTKYERASASIFLDQADEDTGTKPDVPDLRPIAEQDMLQDERMRRIREHVMALPERQRMAVVMHKYQDMDYKQVGAVLKLSESATKSLLFRAYQTLREKLKEFA